MKMYKRHVVGSVVLAAMFGCGAVLTEATMPSQAVAQEEVDEGYFYESLAPDGQWYYQADFGWVWHPTRVATGWRPYTEGQWVWSDAGWTWASNEPWGWATYHYGRWYFDPIYGWSWVPGTTWAPAWVSWRVETDFIGWAPLWPVYFDIHPEYRWERWGYDNDWDRRHHGRDWDRWVFCRDRDFTSDRISRVVVRDRAERDRVFRNSRDVTRWEGGRPDRIGFSVDRARVERTARQPVRSVRLENSDRPGRATVEGDRMRVYRPRVREATDRTPDRMGIAKPPRDASQSDTIKQEKVRLDRTAGRTPRADRIRERDNERGGAPETVERERGAGRGPGAMPTGAGQGDQRGRDDQGPANRTDRDTLDQSDQRGRSNNDRGSRDRMNNEAVDQRDERRGPGMGTSADERGQRDRMKPADRDLNPADVDQRDRGRQGPQAGPPNGRQDDRIRGDKFGTQDEAGPGERQVPRNSKGDARGGAVVRPDENTPHQPGGTDRGAQPASRPDQQRGHDRSVPTTRGEPQGKVRKEAPTREQERVRPQPAPQERMQREQPPQVQRRPETMQRQAPTREPNPQRMQRAPEQRMQRAPEPRVQRAPEQRMQRAPEPRVQRAPEPRVQRAPEPRVQHAPEPRMQPSPSPRGDGNHTRGGGGGDGNPHGHGR